MQDPYGLPQDPGSASPDPSADRRPPTGKVPMPDLARTHHDLLVVGAGSAGLPVAISAAEAGASVLLVDKADELGGSLLWTGGNMSAGGTRRQRARGIEDSAEAHLAEVMEISHGEVDVALTRKAVLLAPATIDWLEDNGFEFDPVTPAITYAHHPYSVPRTYWGVRPGYSLFAVLERLVRPLLADGRVELLLGSRVDELLVVGDRVVGVRAGGRELHAEHVVLATGGYTSNPELCARLSGGARPLSNGAHTSTGDGILLAESVGAALAGLGVFVPTIGGFADPADPTHAYSTTTERLDRLPRLIPQLRPPWEVWVDDGGRRFVCEDEPDIYLREKAVSDAGLAFWVLWDEAVLDAAPRLVDAWDADDLRALAAGGELIVAADTVAGLAGRMGVPPAALEQTVTAYNDAVRSGGPDPMGRVHRPLPLARPPFYAARQYGSSNLSWSGVKVDPDCAVLREDGTVVPGLYAVGEVLGSATFMGSAHVGGLSLVPALALGRQLGATLGLRSTTPAG